MAYKNLGAFLVKVTKKAIAKIDEASPEECMRIATNVSTWAAAGTITEEQLDEIASALPGGEELLTPTYDFTGMTAAEVKRSLSYRPTKDELQQACDWLGLEYEPTATNADLMALIDEAVAAEEGTE